MELQTDEFEATPTLTVAFMRKERRTKSGELFNLLEEGNNSGRTFRTSQGRLKWERNSIAGGLAQQFAFDLVHSIMPRQKTQTQDDLKKRSPPSMSAFQSTQTECPDEEDERLGTIKDGRCSTFTQPRDTLLFTEGRYSTQGRDTSLAEGRDSRFSTQGRDTTLTEGRDSGLSERGVFSQFTECRFPDGRLTSQSSSSGFSVPGQPICNDRVSMKSNDSEMSDGDKQVMVKQALRSLRHMKRRLNQSKSKYNSTPPSGGSSRRPSGELCEPSKTPPEHRTFFHTPSLARLQKENIRIRRLSMSSDGSCSSQGSTLRARNRVPRKMGSAGSCGTPSSTRSSYQQGMRRTFETESESQQSCSDRPSGCSDGPRGSQVFSSARQSYCDSRQSFSDSRQSFSDSQHGSCVFSGGLFSGSASSGTVTPQRTFDSSVSCPASFDSGDCESIEDEPVDNTYERDSMLPARCFQTMPMIREKEDSEDGDDDDAHSFAGKGDHEEDLVLGEF